MTAMSEEFRVLFFGDVVGSPGRRAVQKLVPELKAETQAAFVIANGENSAGGLGIDPKCAREILDAQVDLITSGNHIWNKREIQSYLQNNTTTILRPHNYPEGSPGTGCVVRSLENGAKLGVVNLLGRVFMSDLVQCPFRTFDALWESELKHCSHVVVDFHCEATSEKTAFAYHVDGRATAVLGTHTHVQTADERILPKGTAFISDVGMCGPRDSVIGVHPQNVVDRFLSSQPLKFAIAEGVKQINGVELTFSLSQPGAISISRIQRNIAE